MKGTALGHGWDVLVGAGATVAALILPFGILPGSDISARLERVEWVVTALFVLDIGVRFQYAATPGDTFSERLIAYLKRGGVLDVLAAVPFFAFVGPAAFELLRLLKLYRVGQFMAAWRRGQVRNANMLQLLFFAYGLALTSHWVTCGWIALGSIGGQTGPPYLEALYWCVTTLTTVGYGDVTPQTDAQTVYAIGVMIMGVGVYAYVIGNIASIIANLDPARARHLQHLERVTSFMHYRRLPADLRKRVVAYYDYMWEHRLGYNEADILQTLPPSLRTEIDLHLKGDFLENVPLFKGASDAFIREVALEMRSVVFMPGDYIIRAGDRDRDMFFICRGRVEVRSPDGHTRYSTLDEGDFFGEIALVLEQPRSASVRALDYCDLYRLDRDMFECVLDDYPDIAAQIKQRAQERYQREG